MHGISISLPPTLKTTPSHLYFSTTFPNNHCHLCLQIQSKLSIPTCRFSYGSRDFVPLERRSYKERSVLRSSRRESPYEVLGVSPSSSSEEIKRAYIKLALKLHPDVNKEANVQEKFMRIKHAYNTLLSSETRRKYDFGSQSSDYSYTTAERSQNKKTQDEEDFYGFGFFLKDVQITIEDFFRDIQAEFENWEANAGSQGKPKSLWEELADIGEEFVDFL